VRVDDHRCDAISRRCTPYVALPVDGRDLTVITNLDNAIPTVTIRGRSETSRKESRDAAE